MVKTTYKIIILCTLFLPFYAFSQAQVKVVEDRKQTESFSYGVGVNVNQEIYKGYNTRIMPLPLIGYKGKKLSIFGPFVSYKLADFNQFTFSAKLSPRFQGFDESDSVIFKGMEKRKSSLDAGIDLNYEENDWKIGLTSMFDTLGRSKGYEIKSSFGRVFRYGPIFFEPSVSFSYLDKKHVDYYYGVSISEINQDRIAYNGDSALNKNLGLSISTPVLFGGFTRLSIEHTWYDETITSSPLVEKKTSFNALLIFTKNF
jgi:outer membrane protein